MTPLQMLRAIDRNPEIFLRGTVEKALNEAEKEFNEHYEPVPVFDDPNQEQEYWEMRDYYCDYLDSVELILNRKEDLSAQLAHAEGIYNQLGSKTVNPGSRILIRPWYGRKGVTQTKEIGGVFTLRVPDMEFHLGNPYSSVEALVKRDGLIPTSTTKESVVCFIAWVLYSDDDRASKIREWLDSGVMKGKPLVYYKELNEPSHATALEFLIDNWNRTVVPLS